VPEDVQFISVTSVLPMRSCGLSVNAAQAARPWAMTAWLRPAAKRRTLPLDRTVVERLLLALVNCAPACAEVKVSLFGRN